MSETYPDRPRLRVVRTEDPPQPSRLAIAAALAVDQAELFCYSLDGENLAGDPQRAAYLLGLAEAHLISLVAILRAVTS